MPEILEAGYFFPLYIWLFISLILMITGPEGLRVLALWCDLSDQESKISAQREATLLYHAQTFDPRCIQRGGSLGRWVNDLQDLANAIPDTHGLMIFTVFIYLFNFFADLFHKYFTGMELSAPPCETPVVTQSQYLGILL
jgi:hypothetical protein